MESNNMGRGVDVKIDVLAQMSIGISGFTRHIQGTLICPCFAHRRAFGIIGSDQGLSRGYKAIRLDTGRFVSLTSPYRLQGWSVCAVV